MDSLHPEYGSCQHRLYRLTCEEMAALIHRANDSCEICGRPRHRSPNRRLYIDHDHNIGIWAVRGLLCPSCNTSLGSYPVGVIGFNRRPHVIAYLANPFRTEKPVRQQGRPRRLPPTPFLD